MSDFSQIQIRREPLAGSAFATDYIAGTGDARRFLPADPFALDSFREKLREVSARFGREERERAARAVRPTSEAARERLGRFVETGGAMITTGQQAGLLSGPLYTIYKALTAARLADELERRLETTIVPVFWVASEDHDWEEVRHIFVPMPGDGLKRLELSDGPATPQPMSLHPLGAPILEVLDELSQVLEGAPFAYECITLFRDAYQPGATVAGAFAELMARILAPFGVCITEASDPEVKAASRPVLERALTEAAAHEALLAGRTAELAEAGYTGQVSVLAGATNLFLHGERGRVRVYREGNGLAIPDTGEALAVEDATDRLRRDPAGFSPNVFLRPVVESAVFPTLAYVGGPAELSYFAQIAALFPAFGIAPPIAYPRGTLTLVEPAMQRLLEKLELTPEELARPQHELVDELARRAMPPEVSAIVEELVRSVTEGYRRLIEVAGAIDPTLEEALASLRNQALAKVGDSEKKVVRQLKRKEEIAAGQLERVRANLRPGGDPQDRVLNVFPFLARYGPGLLEEMARALEPELK